MMRRTMLYIGLLLFLAASHGIASGGIAAVQAEQEFRETLELWRAENYEALFTRTATKEHGSCRCRSSLNFPTTICNGFLVKCTSSRLTEMTISRMQTGNGNSSQQPAAMSPAVSFAVASRMAHGGV